MNETVNQFLLAGDKFMFEKHSKQPGFTYSACYRLTKNKGFKNLCKLEMLVIFIETNYIKLVFNMTWLMVATTTESEEQNMIKFLRDKAFEIASNTRYDGYEEHQPKWFKSVLIRNLWVMVLCQANNSQMN